MYTRVYLVGGGNMLFSKQKGISLVQKSFSPKIVIRPRPKEDRTWTPRAEKLQPVLRCQGALLKEHGPSDTWNETGYVYA